MPRRLLLAQGPDGINEAGCRQLRCLGWELYQATSAAEVRRLARRLRPHLIVLDQDLPDESGWLTCAKLCRERPGQQVILLGGARTRENQCFAAFVGAEALVGRDAAGEALLEELSASELLSASA